MHFYFFKQVAIPGLSRNHIYELKSWSAIEEVVRYLHSHEQEHKVEIIHQQMGVSATSRGKHNMYPAEMIVRAFSYYVVSRSLYERLRKDFKLPSVRTLQRITSANNKASDEVFMKNMFSSVDREKKLCVLLHDEVYIKKSLQYHGGEIFGNAENDPSSLAETMLGQMVVCLHGGKTFLTSMLPIAGLSSTFLHNQVTKTMENIAESSGKLKAIICDGNRTNQACFKKFTTVESEPWLTTDGIYLLYDYVHLMKNIRNLWITEVTLQLEYQDNGVTHIAYFQHIRDLFHSEQKIFFKMSDLDETSVYPKPIERQRVKPCLNVFSEKTIVALDLFGNKTKTDVSGTVLFLRKVHKWLV